MLTAPAAASQLIFARVRIEARQNAAQAPTATKTAVHVPCSDKALRLIEVLKMLEPATNT